MSNTKDFQEATAQRIIEIFKGGRKRVLLSDEVGLGKTVMAKRVVELAKTLPGITDDQIYRVVYVCSNQNIIHQNTKNLGIPQKDIMPIQDSRLSMQHLILQERKVRQEAESGCELPQQLIPLTPFTSFSISTGAGSMGERALIFVVLRNFKEFYEKEYNLSSFLKTPYVTSLNNWKYSIAYYGERVEKLGADYINSLEKQLRNNAVFADNLQSIVNYVNGNHSESANKLINQLRIAFAQVSLKLLEPDLVIMDEFQRFSGLLNTNAETEESMIAHEFFANEHPYILLLSATPYKPFTTLEELNEDNCDEQYEDFLKLMKFLFKEKDENKISFHIVWEDYSKKLSQISVGSFDALIVSKQNAEKKMYEAMCRTERYSEGLIRTVNMELAIDSDDIISYCQMQRLLQESKKVLERRKKPGVNPSYNLPIEYAKSSPYLLSFMQKYQEGKTIEAAFNGKMLIPVLKNSRTQKLLLKGNHIYNYNRIEPANAKLAAFEDILFKNNAERLLWVPASHPYYTIPENNVFAKNRDFSKVLVFSAWEMVPRMLAVMLSYESEQRNITGAGHNSTYKKKHSALLKEAALDLLKYQSQYLAGCYNYADFWGQSITDIINRLEFEIQSKIDSFDIEQLNITSAEKLLLLVRKLDGEDVELQGIPKRAARTLAYMAVASPAVCVSRILKESKDANDVDKSEIDCAISGIVNIFNRRESPAIVELSTKKGLEYYEQVLYYCAMGNLQSVLDEYCHMIAEDYDAKEFIGTLNETFVNESTLDIPTTDSFCKSDKKQSMRRSFAFDYSKVKQDKDAEHSGTLQKAFNSPFRPFVLATTSVGQEGLDFHWYTRKIMHWNLPSNPVDMEQRDGRINRYKCLAIRRNVAKFFSNKYTWNDMFTAADEQWRKDSTFKYSEMVPYWCLPPHLINEHKDEIEYIERLVPLYPMSIDEVKYRNLTDILSLYRLTMGQPRQEELLQLLEGRINEEQVSELLFDLSPYSRSKKADS